jgi:hypothetical protein
VTGSTAAAVGTVLLAINGRAVTLTTQGFDEPSARHLMQEVGNAAVPLAAQGPGGARWTCRLARLPGEPEGAELRCEGWLLRVVRPCSSDACHWLLVERRVGDSADERPLDSRIGPPGR